MSAKPERRCQCASRVWHGMGSHVRDGLMVTTYEAPCPCPRDMTGEDLLCDNCRLRAKNHARQPTPVLDPCGWRAAERAESV